MILSAIYIEDHFLFNEPVIVNLGGRNNYSLENGLISKQVNEGYIPNFYSKKKIKLLSAIVGANGSGKSSLLDILINIATDKYGYTSAMIFEDNLTVFVRQRSNVRFNFDYENFDMEISTLYYSPYLDFKVGRNGFDLSLDNTIDNELENVDEIRKSNERVNPIQHLKMRNWIRQMKFINSPIGKEFTQSFDLPTNGLSKITFTRYMINVDKEKDEIQFHNTPYGFRKTIQFIYNKTRKEAEEINKNRPKGVNIVKLQKELLKNYFLMDFICLFIVQMEKENSYLDEGFLKLEYDEFIIKHNSTNALDAFFDFLHIHYYKLQKEEFTLLPINETKELINKVYNFIDQSEANDDRDTKEFDWSRKAIYLNEKKAIELLNLQNEFLDKVENYYRNSEETLSDLKFSEFSRIDDFINFQPSERSLSSGENAFLNLYSRFTELSEKVLIKIKQGKLNTLNFVLLDEADLGFHPKWKKQFVKYILFFFETYFTALKTNAQIIFTTHDPLTLSDVLNYNVIYLNRDKTRIVLNHKTKPNYSFGANISDLLADSFFVEDGLIGDFAKNKIQDVIEYINDENIRPEKEWIATPEIAKKLIDQIGEPYLSEKLNDMFLETFPEYKLEEIRRLEEKIKILKNDSNFN